MRSSKLLFVSLVLNMASLWMWVLEYENNVFLQAWVRENLALSSADLTALVGGVVVGFLGYGGFYFGKKVRARRTAIHVESSPSGEVKAKVKKNRIREL